MSLKLESRGAEEAGEKSQEAVNLIIRKEVEREFRRKVFYGTGEVSIFLYKHAVPMWYGIYMKCVFSTNFYYYCFCNKLDAVFLDDKYQFGAIMSSLLSWRD